MIRLFPIDSLAEGGDADFPAGFDPMGVDGKDVITGVSEWICSLLGWVPLDEVWKADAGRPDWTPPDAAEEAWAKRVAELFLGCAYGGPEGTAAFREPRLRTNLALLHIYQRFQPRFVEWKTPDDYFAALAAYRRKEEGPEPKDNDDPAYSLVVACQSLTTLAGLSRGLMVEKDLGFGFPARQCPTLAVFNEAGGRWIDEPEAQQTIALALDNKQELAPGTIFTFNPLGNLQKINVSVPLEGVLAILRKSIKKDGSVDLARFEMHMEMAHSLRIVEEEQDAHKIGRGAAEIGQKLQAVAGMNDVSAALAETGKLLTAYKVKRFERLGTGQTDNPAGFHLSMSVTPRMQQPGSHINCVLRRWRSKAGVEMVQLLDTTLHGGQVEKASKESCAIHLTDPLGKGGDVGGIVDGNPVPMIRPASASRFVGTGILPAPMDLARITAFVAKARPVGLARLVLTLHGPPTKNAIYNVDPLTFAHVLYVSKLALTWGPDPKANYPPARYLLSLRNIPYFKKIRAYWMIYAPRYELADVMWAPGRARPLSEMIDAAAEQRKLAPPKMVKGVWKPPPALVLSTADALLPVTLLMSSTDSRPGEPPEGVAIAWQGHELRQPNGRGTPPKILRDLLITPPYQTLANNTRKGDFSLFEELRIDPRRDYVHPEIDPLYDDAPIVLPPYLT